MTDTFLTQRTHFTDIDTAFTTEAAAGVAEIDAALADDTEETLPSLEYMRGWLSHLGPHLDHAEGATIRYWLEGLIEENERLRSEMLDLSPAPQSVNAEQLSTAELRVFRYLHNTTMRGDEIAAALFVSHNTVKTHCKSIYRKLGVTSRGELRTLKGM